MLWLISDWENFRCETHQQIWGKGMNKVDNISEELAIAH